MRRVTRSDFSKFVRWRQQLDLRLDKRQKSNVLRNRLNSGRGSNIRSATVNAETPPPLPPNALTHCFPFCLFVHFFFLFWFLSRLVRQSVTLCFLFFCFFAFLGILRVGKFASEHAPAQIITAPAQIITAPAQTLLPLPNRPRQEQSCTRPCCFFSRG